MMKLLVAAALAGVVKGQSQCSPDYLAQINTLCCTDASGQDICHGVCARAHSLCVCLSLSVAFSHALFVFTQVESRPSATATAPPCSSCALVPPLVAPSPPRSEARLVCVSDRLEWVRAGLLRQLRHCRAAAVYEHPGHDVPLHGTLPVCGASVCVAGDNHCFGCVLAVPPVLCPEPQLLPGCDLHASSGRSHLQQAAVHGLCLWPWPHGRRSDLRRPAGVRDQ